MLCELSESAGIAAISRLGMNMTNLVMAGKVFFPM